MQMPGRRENMSDDSVCKSQSRYNGDVGKATLL
jgi:hypothetical protein